jgi:hypothetical protein
MALKSLGSTGMVGKRRRWSSTEVPLKREACVISHQRGAVLVRACGAALAVAVSSLTGSRLRLVLAAQATRQALAATSGGRPSARLLGYRLAVLCALLNSLHDREQQPGSVPEARPTSRLQMSRARERTAHE